MEADQVTPEARFAEDLDADSLDLVELVMELEEEFDITVEEEELQDLPTIGDAFASLYLANCNEGTDCRNRCRRC